MRKVLLFAFVLIISQVKSISQQKHPFGVNFFVPVGRIDYSSGMCDCGKDVNKGIRVGADFSYSPIKHLSIVSGLEYYHLELEYYSIMPGFSNLRYPGKQQILTFPLYLKLNFLRYFYISGGFLFDKELLNENAPTINGSGLLFGFGVQYTLKNRINFSIAPTLQVHTGRSTTLYDGGTKLSLGYKF